MLLHRCSILLLVALPLLPAAPSSQPADSVPVLISRTAGKGPSNQWESPAARQKAADAGDPVACYEVGEIMLNSQGAEKNIAKAVALLEIAARNGSIPAAFRLGKLNDDGEVVEKNYAKAMEYYRAAALAGSAEAQYNLGAMYVSARGVKRDYVEGLAWFILATRNGADGDGEQQVRQRLTSTNRSRYIAPAEARADALAKENTPPAALKPVLDPVRPPRVDTLPGTSNSRPIVPPPKIQLAPPPRLDTAPVIAPPAIPAPSP